MPISQTYANRVLAWGVLGAGLLTMAAGGGAADAATALRPRVAAGGAAAGPAAPPSAAAVSFGPAATTAPTLSSPYGVAVDSTGQVYVTNLGGGVTVYSPQRALIGTISAGVSNPVGVGVAANGNIYVANNGASNVTVYNRSFAQIGTITSPLLAYPTGLVVDAVNDIWVLDSSNLHLLMDNGTEVSHAAANGASAIAPWAGNIEMFGVYAGTPGQFLDYIQNIGEAAHYGVGFNGGFGDSYQAGGAAEDALHQTYETVPASNLVVIYASDGSAVAGGFNTASAPYGIAVDSTRKRIYVAETAANLVAVYSTVSPFKLLGVIH